MVLLKIPVIGDDNLKGNIFHISGSSCNTKNILTILTMKSKNFVKSPAMREQLLWTDVYEEAVSLGKSVKQGRESPF